MNKSDIVHLILNSKKKNNAREKAIAFAPVNIALCKYWGKRVQELNLPVTSSLSMELPNRGTKTQLTITSGSSDELICNGERVNSTTDFFKKTTSFLDLFRQQPKKFFRIDTQNQIPLGAGLASSASGFAALVLALNKLFDWNCSEKELSILARLGSGSASRSVCSGFVEWERGERADGMDSYARSLGPIWPELRLGILMISREEKPISSRVAMELTLQTSILYSAWPKQVEHDLNLLKLAIHEKDFELLGQTAECNALAMHATMLAARPPISYTQLGTWSAILKIWALRKEGLQVYFTQDAGPNLKLLFLEEDRKAVEEAFPEIEVDHS